jgi:leader peptidase (prepilin peptidase) / N-methyltransferase
VTVSVLVGLGLVVGTALPILLAVLPDRMPEDGEPVRTPYRVLASAPRLRPLLGAATGVTWGVLAASLGWAPYLPAYLWVGTLGVVMAYVDLREHRLPDPLTAAALVGGGLLLAVAAAATGEWGAYGRAWLAAVAMFGTFLALALLRPADLGLGDVKLAGVLGLVLGWQGWGVVVVGAFFGFLFGGLTGVGLMLVGRAGRRSTIPFGPFMLLGALVAVAWGHLVVDAYVGG